MLTTFTDNFSKTLLEKKIELLEISECIKPLIIDVNITTDINEIKNIIRHLNDRTPGLDNIKDKVLKACQAKIF